MSVKLAKNGDPKENPRLATALQKAKALNFPKERIEELINRVRQIQLAIGLFLTIQLGSRERICE